ncbi:MAG: hypothetical protein ABSG28_07490 [Methanoregula sp.]|jgi:hypothetical protein|uniref:hypothetical protein n=1 Tax=Methanoregula sp. TaxID=2052170 RepID=UPI003C14440D
MQTNEQKIRLIRDRLTRIGIREKDISDETILASYSINNNGQLCGVQKSQPPLT